MFFASLLLSLLIMPSVFTRNFLDTKVLAEPLPSKPEPEASSACNYPPIGGRVGKSHNAPTPSESERCHQVPATLCW